MRYRVPRFVVSQKMADAVINSERMYRIPKAILYLNSPNPIYFKASKQDLRKVIGNNAAFFIKRLSKNEAFA